MGYVVKNTSGGSLGLQLESGGLSLQNGSSYDVYAVCSVDWILYNSEFRALITGGQLTVTEDTVTGQSEQFPAITEDSSGNVAIANDLSVDGDLNVEGDIVGQLDITAVDDLTVTDLLTTKDLSMSGDVQTDLSVLGEITKTQNSIIRNLADKTTTDITLYVRSGGSDTNTGLSVGAALATVQEALDRIPKHINHDVLVDVGPGSFANFRLTDFIMGRKADTTAATLIVSGTLDNPTLAGGTASGTADGGSTTQIADSGQAWVVNALRGMLALVAGEYRVIISNTGTEIELQQPFSATASGKDYEIVEQKTVIDSGTSMVRVAATGVFAPYTGSIIVENIATSGGTVGFYPYQGYNIGFRRVKASSSFYGMFFSDLVGRHNLSQVYIYNATGIGLGCERTPGVTSYGTESISDVYIYGGCSTSALRAIGAGNFAGQYVTIDNTTADQSILCSTSGPNVEFKDFTVLSGTVGIHCSCVIHMDFDGVTTVKNCTSHGIVLESCPWVDLDKALIDNNGGYGVKVDENALANRVGGTFLNLAADVTISNNTSGGIIGLNHSVLALSDCDGSGNGNYGIELQTGSTATITGDTAVTGGSGDATIDEGSTTLSYAGDFAADGDFINNTDNFCLLERKD